MSLHKINNIISTHLKNKKIKTFGHGMLFIIIVILTVKMTYNDENGYARYEYSVLYEWILYFIVIMGIVYINLLVLVPSFLLKGKLTRYICFIGLCVVSFLIVIIAGRNLFFDEPSENNTKTVLMNILGAIISVGLVIVSTSIFSLFREWKKYNQLIIELEASTIDAELQQLKNQINPHFLFNTINNANIKVEKDPEVAYSIITKLKDLLCYQLTNSAQGKICLKNDISFLSDYLDMEKIRRNKFFYTLKVDDNVCNLEVSPLLFIPFVENAVKHSLTTKGESKIIISFTMEKNHLHFYCENSKPSVPIRPKSGGLGLKNIKRRLDLLYNDAYILDIINLEEKYIINLYLKI